MEKRQQNEAASDAIFEAMKICTKISETFEQQAFKASDAKEKSDLMNQSHGAAKCGDELCALLSKLNSRVVVSYGR
jgi:hypothetical protein